jgi:hypothetical protein
MTKKIKAPAPPAYSWVVPDSLNVPADPLRCRLDFHQQAVRLTIYKNEGASTKLVSATDVAHALASELSYNSGLLPEGTLWWSNTSDGPVFAIYEAPRIRILALNESVNQVAKRYTVPLPGMLLLVSPGKAPHVYAVKEKPAGPSTPVFHPPICNVYEDGHSCPGNNKYPSDASDIPAWFWRSFFSKAMCEGRSNKFKKDVTKLWAFLDGKKTFPLDDLIACGTVKDLMNKRITR